MITAASAASDRSETPVSCPASAGSRYGCRALHRRRNGCWTPAWAAWQAPKTARYSWGTATRSCGCYRGGGCQRCWSARQGARRAAAARRRAPVTAEAAHLCSWRMVQLLKTGMAAPRSRTAWWVAAAAATTWPAAADVDSAAPRRTPAGRGSCAWRRCQGCQSRGSSTRNRTVQDPPWRSSLQMAAEEGRTSRRGAAAMVAAEQGRNPRRTVVEWCWCRSNPARRTADPDHRVRRLRRTDRPEPPSCLVVVVAHRF